MLFLLDMPVLSKSFRPSKSSATLVTGAAALALIFLGVKYWKHRKRQVASACTDKGLTIFYSTQKGQSKAFAHELETEGTAAGLQTLVLDLSTFEPEALVEQVNKNYCVFVIPTYTDGFPANDCKWFYTWLGEAATDFRYGSSYLQGLQYCVVGLGNSLYGSNFCKVAKNIDEWLSLMSAESFLDVTLCDEDVASSLHGSLQKDFTQWKLQFWSTLAHGYKPRRRKKPKRKKAVKSSCEKKAGTCSCRSNDTQTETAGNCYNSSDDEQPPEPLMDLEDMGPALVNDDTSSVLREMVTPTIRKSLEKQGYKIVGTHSGVKLCRWTKSMLRGRGGCYKHTFYGIESHRCMETTPSLACANKCVFCWRHHTNPVGTEWKWKMDSAEEIVQGALDNHRNMINQFKGVPGVKPDKIMEGMAVQHCALSLVGEPIMYPEINKFVDLLHSQNISSFLVTNAQFPDAIRDMRPVTQLYVSVDASTKESLKKIDRPLFVDFWERFIDSLRHLKNKGQRTVYRLTLVKSFNTEELDEYARLVSLGEPDFIEVKGVTFCGDSKASDLTMKNVPWHHEVVNFCQQLCERLPGYAVSCEHEHSNCVLISHNKFYVENEWWTWIDYEKFHKLTQKFMDTGVTFGSSDYMVKTPSWAVIGSDERGFDPQETRFHRKKQASKHIEGVLSGSPPTR
ncbi:S-adenosyl-L-methionine-dependent tRNA 4-demethylwyosine synthase TYW1-like [Watersipora subatra]|uniref:S-adenosyl-L-methionine-dependent tRNA 4-demethylwyosine synthase TYW1-like n=1 Tax=Watersipora subatra TaxID=2589382 RepID=UPI00355BAFE1